MELWKMWKSNFKMENERQILVCDCGYEDLTVNYILNDRSKIKFHERNDGHTNEISLLVEETRHLLTT